MMVIEPFAPLYIVSQGLRLLGRREVATAWHLGSVYHHRLITAFDPSSQLEGNVKKMDGSAERDHNPYG
jgi:hypothetical protein